MARKRHHNRRNTPGHRQQSCSSKNNSPDATSGKVQQAALRRHQQNKHTAATDRRTSTTEPTHGLPSAEKINSPHGNTNSCSRGASDSSNTFRSTRRFTTSVAKQHRKAPTQRGRQRQRSQTHHSQLRQPAVTPDQQCQHHRQSEPSLTTSLKAVKRSNSEQPHKPQHQHVGKQLRKPKTNVRITKVTIQTKQGTEITAYSCEDVTEQETEEILLEPWVTNTEGLEKRKTIEGMKHEIQSMKTTTGLHGSTPRHTHTTTTTEHQTISLGPPRERQHGPSTDRRQRLY